MTRPEESGYHRVARAAERAVEKASPSTGKGWAALSGALVLATNLGQSWVNHLELADKREACEHTLSVVLENSRPVRSRTVRTFTTPPEALLDSPEQAISEALIRWQDGDRPTGR